MTATIYMSGQHYEIDGIQLAGGRLESKDQARLVIHGSLNSLTDSTR